MTSIITTATHQTAEWKEDYKQLNAIQESKEMGVEGYPLLTSEQKTRLKQQVGAIFEKMRFEFWALTLNLPYDEKLKTEATKMIALSSKNVDRQISALIQKEQAAYDKEVNRKALSQEFLTRLKKLEKMPFNKPSSK